MISMFRQCYKKRRSIITLLLVGAGLFIFHIFTARAVTTYYFNNAVNTNPATLGNYWLNAGHTVPATTLPDLSVDILNILSGSTYNGSPNIRGGAINSGTITGNATFYDNANNEGIVSGNAIFYSDSNNNGTVNGNATFYEALSQNYGTVNGLQIRRFTTPFDPEISFDFSLSYNGHPWTVMADGAEIDITACSYDETTTFDRVNGGNFISDMAYTGKTVLGTTLHLNFNKTLNTLSIPATSNFSVTVNGNSVAVTHVSISGEKIILTLNTTVVFDDTVIATYTVGANQILSSQGLNIGGFVGETIKTSIPVGNAPVYSTLVGTKLYVSNNHSSSVTVIDTTTDSVLSTIAVGNYPELSVLVGTKLYVNDLTSNTVSVINTLTDTVVATIPVADGPYFSTLVGTKLYVGGTNTNTVSVINTLTDTVVATITVGSAPWRSGSVGTKLYVPNYNTGTVSVINTVTDTVSATITVGNNPSFALGLGTKMYISNFGSGTVSVINTLTDTVSSTITTGGNPYFSNFYDTKVFVPTRGGNKIVIINSATDTIISSLTANDTPYDTKVIGNKVYVSNVGANTVTIVNPATNSIVQTVATGSAPFYITAVGNKIYSSDNNNSGVSVFDTTSVTSQLPNLVSFTSTTSDGQYSTGSNINITANFGRPLINGSTMTIVLNSGASVVLNTVSGTTLSGTYTIGGGEATPDLSISSISSASVTDTSAHNRTSYSLPSSQGDLVAENSFITRNLGDTKNIVVGSYQVTGVGENPYQLSAPITVDGIPYLYVANQGDNSVSVIRKNDNIVTAVIPVGSEPYGLATTSISGITYIYVANTGSNSVSVIDTSNNSVISTITVGVKPYYVAILGTNAYVTNSLSNTVSVISTVTNAVTTTIPVGVYPRGIRVYNTYLYVANYGDPNYSGGNTISVINSATNTVSATIILPAGSSGPRGITSLGTKVYVANFRSNNVSVIDTATNSITATIVVGTGPRGIIGTGTTLYVENFDDGTISVINTGTNTVTATVKVGHSPAGMSLSGTDIYFTRFQDNKVSIFNTVTNTLRSAFPVLSAIGTNSVSPTVKNVVWATDIAADSTVEYGMTSSYGSSTTATALTTTHSLSLSNLAPISTYHYRVISTDAAGNTSTSTDQTFTTTVGGIGIANPPSVEIEQSGLDTISGLVSPTTETKDSRSNITRINNVLSRIFLAVEDHGRLWYQYPFDNKRYEVNQKTALDLFRKVALGITNNDLNRIPVINSQDFPSSLSQRLQNLFLLQVENRGQTWFVDQAGYRHFVTRFNIIDMSREVMAGILNEALHKIPIGDLP